MRKQNIAHVEFASPSLEKRSRREVTRPIVAAPVVVGEKVARKALRFDTLCGVPLVQLAKVVRIGAEADLEVAVLFIHMLEEWHEIVVVLRPFRFGVEAKVVAEHHQKDGTVVHARQAFKLIEQEFRSKHQSMFTSDTTEPSSAYFAATFWSVMGTGFGPGQLK